MLYQCQFGSQISHYVYLYISEEEEGPINVIVPTGAAGNLCSGLYAKLMGIPLNLYTTTNENDCVSMLLSKGVLSMGKEIIPTSASAMDICNPYNVERILHLFTTDPETVKSIMATVGPHEIDEEIVKKLQAHVKGSKSVEDSLIFETMRSIYEINDYLVRHQNIGKLSKSEEMFSLKY